MHALPTSNAAAPAAPSARPLRVLHVLGYAGGGGRRFGITGVERVVQILLEGLDPARFEQYLVYPQRGELWAAYAARAGAMLDREPVRRYDPGYARALAGFVHTHAIDLVVSHGHRFDFHAALACRRARVPHVVVRAVALADEAMPQHRRLLFGLVDGWTLGRCRGIVAVSEASRRRMLATQRLPAAKVAVIPNGARVPEVSATERRDARRALGVGDDQLLVGGVGQLIPRKAFHVLVEALGTLRARHPEVVGAVLGEGPERPLLERSAAQRGVRLLLPGYVPNPYPTLASFDVAVLPSRAEGMPLVVLEAMALGVACVATPVAGTAELIEDGISGRLVPPDDPPALAAALADLLADAPMRTRLAVAGQRRILERHGIDAMLGAFATYLTNAAEAPR